MSGKPKILLFLKRQSLILVLENKKIANLELKEDVYSDLEIRNHGNFVKAVSDFFRSLGVKKTEAVLVFAKEVVFEKYVETTDTNTEKIEKEFFSSVPFEDRLQAKKVIRDPKGIRMIAVNGDLIRTLVLALTPLGIKFGAILPATIFKISGEGNAIGVADALMIMGDKKTMEAANFLEIKKKEVKNKNEEEESGGDERDEENKPRFNQKILLVIGVTLIVGAIIITLMAVGVVKNPFVKDTKVKKTPAQTEQVPAAKLASPAGVLNNKIAGDLSKEATKEATNEAKLVP